MFKDKKVLIITPHLSTGGCPQYLLNFLLEYHTSFSDLLVIEHSNFSNEFVIQKNKIKNLIGEDKLITLGNHGEKEPIYSLKRNKLIEIIQDFNPDVIWMNEFPESYDYQLPPKELMDFLYQKDRDYKIVETTHYNAFNFDNKKYIPDEFMFCSNIHIDKSKNIDIPKYVWEVPIENKIRPNRNETLKKLGLDPNKLHILNVGLFHTNKNQKYIFEIAKNLVGKNIEFHFIGNTCFLNECGIYDYLNLSNCRVWGERNDVDMFMSCMDIYLFPSKKELNPLTVKEALSWGMDVVVNRDENYTHQYIDLNNFYILDEINIYDFINERNIFGNFLLVTSFYNNTKEHVEQTFRNVLNQTYTNWKLIVGDDFSNDPDFRQYLKNRIIEINDSRILYYDVKFKRELFLQQNFFKYFDYDYYFDLDSDDIIHNRILEIYNKYFINYPDVYSIFSNFYETDEDLNVQKFALIQPPDDYIEEYNYYTNTNTSSIWVDRPYYGMYGHGRCMRRPLDDKLKIVENVKTSADTLMLFYNLIRGKHLHIPRNLYTYVRRPNSDSSVIMSTEEYSKFNLNAEKYIKKYSKIEPTGSLDLFKELWFETSALSTCEFIDDVNELSLITNLTENEKKVINDLYFDKKISYNNYDSENVIVVYNKLPNDFEWNKLKAKNITIYNYNDDYTYSEETMFDKFNEVNNNIVKEISEKINGFTWFNFFRHLSINKTNRTKDDVINITYNDGVKLEIIGENKNEYEVKFYNDENNQLIYETKTHTNMWTRPSLMYYIKWRVEVYLKNKLIKSETLNLQDRKVLITFDSKSLGDSIAWIPYIEEFRKKHKCEVYCATFRNELYEEEYPNINFVNIGENKNNYYANYHIGWYYDNNKNPKDVRTIPLQNTASDILGLEHKEIRTKITKPKLNRPIDSKYVTISIHSTSQCKYWNKIGGWENIVDYIKSKGYEVMCVDHFPIFGIGNTFNKIPENTLDYTSKTFEEFMNNIYHSEFHIGVGSGDTWLAWGLGKKVLMVSSFSKPLCEFTEDCYRVYKDTEYSGYFNNLNFKFDPSDWNWNPYKKMETLEDWDNFEPIEVEDVKNVLNELL